RHVAPLFCTSSYAGCPYLLVVFSGYGNAMFLALLSCFFLFYSYGHHRHLHSFPTRRSSDLYLARHGETPFNADGNRYCGKTDVRSEEHTSELQSRENLVCRLLLEKKKKAITLPLWTVRWQSRSQSPRDTLTNTYRLWGDSWI